MPATASLYLDFIKSMIKFEMLNPDSIIQIFVPDFSLKHWITNPNRIIVNKDQEQSVLGDFEVYIGLVFIAALIIILMIILMIMRPFRNKISCIFIKLKQNFVWNGLI